MVRKPRLTGLCLTAVVALLAAAAPSAADNSKYFPADVEIILNVNLKQVMDSELVQGKKETVAIFKAMAEQALQQNEEAAKFFKELGFDPFRDLQGVSVAMPGSTDPTKGIVIVNGTVDAKRFAKVSAEVARVHGDVVKLTKVGKRQVVEVTPPGEDKTVCLCLAEPNVLLLTQGKAAMEAALERGGKAGAGKGAGLKKEVRDLLASSDPKASLSFVATSAALIKLSENENFPEKLRDLNVGKTLEKMTGFNGSVTLKKEIEFQLGVGTANKESAAQFAFGASLGLNFAKQTLTNMAKDDERVALVLPVVNTLSAKANGTTVVIRGQVTVEVLEKALKLLQPQQ
jgi:hypothetical protein